MTPLERALLIARRNWILLLVCFLVVPGAALAYSGAQTPEYTASASLLFIEKDASQVNPERAAATNLALVSLDQVAARTASTLSDTGLTVSEVSNKVSVSPAGESDLVQVEATDADPVVAAKIANEFARQFIAFRRDANRAKVLKALGLIEARLNELAPNELGSPEAVALENRKRDLAVRATLQTGEAQLVQPATAPSAPSTPKTTRNVALGILLGLVLGISLALLRDQFDRRLKTVEEAEDAFGLSVLATIPQSRNIGGGDDADATLRGEEAESFRMLRANLQYFGIDQELKSILITSPASEDGKTMVAWNLALTEAHAGKRILFIEADLRRPTIAAQLHLLGEKGLGLVLAGGLEAKAAIQKAQGVDILPAGPLPPNPAELIDSQRMEDLLEWAEREYDRVVVDTPPAAVVADALPLIKRVDRMLVVVRLRRTARDAAERLREQLANIDAPVIGIVINGAAAKADDSYYRSPAISDSFAKMQESLAASDSPRGQTAPDGGGAQKGPATGQPSS
ncbi:MAG TPA: polysaccharide biosynthesis tyrosine autokinase [Solirubrobacterales bacterium]|nr:polysaccharide biosynthesis tyrosine autokinase [Solirubrobacterales bacterium]